MPGEDSFGLSYRGDKRTFFRTIRNQGTNWVSFQLINQGCYSACMNSPLYFPMDAGIRVVDRLVYERSKRILRSTTRLPGGARPLYSRGSAMMRPVGAPLSIGDYDSLIRIALLSIGGPTIYRPIDSRAGVGYS
jgi:hypothetical protein